ncbi:Protein AHNAK2, partial [Chlamydotis macqueenii]
KPEVNVPKTEMDISIRTGDVLLSTCEEDDLTSKSAASLSTSDIKIITESSLEVKSPDISAERTSSEISVGDVEVKIEGPKGKTKMSKFQMPKFGITHSTGKGPEVKITKDENKALEADVHLPSADISIPKPDSDVQDSDAALPKGEIKQDGDGEEKEGHFKMPKFKLPSFSWSPKKEASVKLDSGANLEDHKLPVMSGRIDTEARETITDDQGTGPALDLEISAGKVEQKSPTKKPQFVMPKISLSKIKVPKSQIHSSKVEADTAIPETEREGDVSIQIPDIEKSHSARTEEGSQISIRLADVKIPTLEFSKIETGASQTDMGVSSAKIDAALPPSEGSFQEVVLKSKSQSVSKPRTEGATESLEEKEIKLKEEHKIKTEEVQTEEHQGWFKMPKFRIPAFGRTSLKEKKSDADIERSMEKTQAGIPSAEVQIETSIPEKSLSLPHAVAEIAIRKEEIPELGDSVKSSDVSLPKMEGDISLSAERTDSRVSILKTETYADIVKRGAEGQKMHTSEFTVSSAELSKSYLSASEIDKDSLTNKFPTCTLTVQEHKVQSQDIGVPRVESSTKLESSEVGEMQFQKSEGITGLKSSALDHMETSARITVETVEKSQSVPEVNIKIPKLRIPRFTFKALPTEAVVSVSKVVTDPKGSSTDIEVVQLQASSAVPEETPEALEGGIQKAKSKILTLTEPDIKTAQMTTTIESSLSNVGQDLHWSYVEGQEVSEKVEPEHVAIERCEIYTAEILKESEVLSSEVKTATLGFSLLKVKLPESHSNLEVLVQQPSSADDVSVSKPECTDESFGVAAQRTCSAELKVSGKPCSETEESSGDVSLPKLETFAVEVKPSSKLEETHPDKSREGITAGPLSKYEGVAEAVEDEEKDRTNEKEKTDSKRSPGRFKFWLPTVGFSSSGDETSTDSKAEVKKSVPEEVKSADASDHDSSKQTEKTGWFRFPKLGFTSPSKKAKTVDKVETGHKEGRISDEDSPSDKIDVFFDAQESLSPKETTEGEKVEIHPASSDVPVSRTIVTSSARTELILLEEEK